MSSTKQPFFIHGVSVLSALELPGLVGSPLDHVDVRIESPIHSSRHHDDVHASQGSDIVLQADWYQIRRLANQDTSGDPNVNNAGCVVYDMAYPHHGFSFTITLSNGCVCIQPIVWSPEWKQMLPIMASGAVLGFACRLLGRSALHANSVRLHNQTIAIAGESGAGKTLTSALLLTAGAELITDDVTVLAKDLVVHPGLTEVRLRVEEPVGEAVASMLCQVAGVTQGVTADDRLSFRFHPTERLVQTTLDHVLFPIRDPEAIRVTLEPIALGESLIALLKAARLVGWVEPEFLKGDFTFAADIAEGTQIHRLRMPELAANRNALQAAARDLADLFAPNE